MSHANPIYQPGTANTFGEVDDILMWFVARYDLSICMDQRGCDVRHIYLSNGDWITVQEPEHKGDGGFKVVIAIQIKGDQHFQRFTAKSRLQLFEILRLIIKNSGTLTTT